MDRIFFFSSTGNSLYLAKRIGEHFGVTPEYIPTVTERTIDTDRMVVVSPIYSFGLPKHVYDFLMTVETGAALYVVLSYGGMIGGADRLVYTLCAERGLNIRAVYTVKMVENFTLDFTVPKPVASLALKRVPTAINHVIAEIASGNAFVPKGRTDKRATYEKNKANWNLLAKDFCVTEDCVLCGKCASICPANNIAILDGRVQFGNACVACLGCYHRCPKQAIRYKNRKKKDRYFCPLIDRSELDAAIQQK